MTLNPYQWRNDISKLHDDLVAMDQTNTFDVDTVLERMAGIINSIRLSEPDQYGTHDMFGWRLRLRLFAAAFRRASWNHGCHYAWLAYDNARLRDAWEKTAIAWQKRAAKMEKQGQN